jgi:hypothetical protein
MRADAIGINFAFIVADPHPDGFSLPTDRLLRTIDEVVRVAAAPCSKQPDCHDGGARR